MSKGPDFKKQTSTVSAARALEVLTEGGFVVGIYEDVPEIKTAYRKDVMAARRKFGEKAAISATGRSVIMVGPHAQTKQRVEVTVPLEDMLGHGALDALRSKTGLIFTA